MDIFPDTVSAFAATIDAGDGGRRLKWDERFPTLADGDGDGLRSGVKGGIDPDDANWDSDGDTLADGYELKRRQDGEDFSPLICDTDGDTLPDVQEALIGSNPNSPDTDNDGLKDREEVHHRVINCNNGQLEYTNRWEGGLEIMIAPGGIPITTAVTSQLAVSVWVSSDPTEADADQDGIPDDAEFELAMETLPDGSPHWFARLDPDGNPYNPNVPNTSPLQVSVITDALNGYVKVGQSVAYTTTVNQLIDFADGVLEVTVPPQLGGGDAPLLHLVPGNATTPTDNTYRNNLTVAIGTSSGSEFPVFSTARARRPSAPEDTWEWLAPTGTELLNRNQNNSRGLDVAAARYDRADGYLFSGVKANASGRGTSGDVAVYSPFSGSSNGAIESDNNDSWYRRADGPSSTACTSTGQCMVVWDHIYNCSEITLDQFTLTNEGKDHVTSGAEIDMYFAEDGGPNPKPTDSVWRKVWSWADHNGLDMDSGTQVGPYARGAAQHTDLLQSSRCRLW